MSAELTTFTPEEESAICHAQTFKILTTAVSEWGQIWRENTPVAICAGIDALAQALIVYVGEEAAVEFLDELSSALRRKNDSPPI